jgi:hypothetical protein
MQADVQVYEALVPKAATKVHLQLPALVPLYLSSEVNQVR